MGIQEALLEGFAEQVAEAKAHNEAIINSQLGANEKCLAFYCGETKWPFILRILPYVSDFLFRSKNHLLAITDHRVLIMHVSDPIGNWRPSRFKRIVASLPFAQLAGAEPKTGRFTSSICIKACDGRMFRFVDMLKSSAEKFANDLQMIRKAAAKVAKEQTAVPAAA